MPEAPLIAIVDDDKSIRNATQDLLKAAGFSTATFEDGESFLYWANRTNAACLVTDMRMPRMTGLELYRALAATGQHIPTVIITAHPEELTQARARYAGITFYLIKPFAPDELLDCVRAALTKSQARLATPSSQAL